MTDPGIEEIEDNLAQNLMVDNQCVRWLLGKCKRLQAIVDKLPKTADGASVVPGMTVWYHDWLYKSGEDSPLLDEIVVMSRPQVWGSPEEWTACYSTKEAAEAAGKEAKDGQEDTKA